MTNKLPNNFIDTQQKFTDYIRDPINNPALSDIKKPRLDMYRELVFNNLEGFLANNFPVLKTILHESQWSELLQDFLINHKSKSPYFAEIPEEFINFLQHERNNLNDYPFLLELAHYEWVEMALSISKQNLPPQFEYVQDLLQLKISLSPLAWSLVYQYPVHKISPQYLPTQAPEELTYLVVYRDAEDEIHFIQTTAVMFRLLQLLEQQAEISVEKLLKNLDQEIPELNLSAHLEAGLEMIQGLAQKNIIIY